jgi:probable HAF family extracellular repeat protein
LSAVVIARRAQAQINYTVTDLGAQFSGTSEADGINNAGQVLGDYQSAGGNTQGFVYSNGAFTNLAPAVGFTQVNPVAINNNGLVVAMDVSGGSSTTVLYSGGTPTNLGSLNGLTPYAINDSGVIAGIDQNAGQNRAVTDTYNPSTGTTTISALGSLGYGWTTADAINNSGVVTGEALTSNGLYQVYSYSNGVMTNLNSPYSGNASGHSINAQGDIAGYTENGLGQAFLYKNGQFTALTLPGQTHDTPDGINDYDSVVGTAFVSSASTAFLYTPALGTVNLNSLISPSSGWTLKSTSGINDAGQIVGTGVNAQGQTHAFLLTPSIASVTTTTMSASAPLITTNKPTINNLDIFNPSAGLFQSTQNGGEINTSLPTVVLTLGFGETVQGQNAWPIAMAKDLPGAGTAYNVVAWDWSADADTNNLPLSDSRTASQGAALGETLLTLFGTNYTQSLHFMGHSLGTLVNSEAITVLNAHGMAAPVQDTLFDEASIANNIPGAAPAYPVNAIPTNSQGQAIPIARIDNYVSSFGNVYSQAANFILQLDPSNPPPSVTDAAAFAEYIANFHNYPVTWYQNTLPGQSEQASPVGYAGAIEGSNFNPSNPVYQSGTYSLQSTNPGGDYTFSSISGSNATQFLLNRNDQQLAALEALNLSGETPEAAVVAEAYVQHYLGVSVEQLTGAIEYENAVAVNTVPIQSGSSQTIFSPQLVLSKELNATMAAAPSTAQGNRLTSNDKPVAADAPSAYSSYAWIPLAIPADEQYLSMDFTFHDLSSGDFLSIGINDTPLFQLEDEFVVDGVAENTGLIDVSQWAGQSVQLFLGLNAADDLNDGGTITVDNMSFESIPEPATGLAIAVGLFVMSIRRCHVGRSRVGRTK